MSRSTYQLRFCLLSAAAFCLLDSGPVTAGPLFGPWIHLSTPSRPEDVEVADLDKDGYQDVAAAVLGGWPPPGAVVFKGNGDGTFEECPVFHGGPARCLAIGDFNQDGAGELIISQDWENDYFGAALSCVWQPSCVHNQSAGYGIQFLDAAPMDGDSLPDIVFGSRDNTGTFTVLFNGGTSCFVSRTSYSVGPKWLTALKTADLNGDGANEVVCAYRDFQTAGVSIFKNDGDGVFTLQREIPTPNYPGAVSLAVGDLNGDGKPDLVVENLLFRGGSLGNILVPGTTLATGAPQGVLIHDFTADGIADLVVADDASGTLRIYPGPITTSLPEAIEIPLEHEPYGPLMTRDMNNDGLSDLVLGLAGGVDILLAEGPTPVILTSFEASIENGRPVVRWEIAEEARRYEFRLWRQMGNEERRMIDSHGWNGELNHEYRDLEIPAGDFNLSYWLQVMAPSGHGTLYGPLNLSLVTSAPYPVIESRPNPFRNATTLHFSLQRPGPVRIDIIDIEGRLVAVPMDGWQDAGSHAVYWNGQGRNGTTLPQGTYFARLTPPDAPPAVRKVTLVR